MMRWLARALGAFAAVASVAFATADPRRDVSELLAPRSTHVAMASSVAPGTVGAPRDAWNVDVQGAYAQGRRLFETPWVEAPASVAHLDGLGPFFSSRSCSGCHGGAGRGRPPEGPETRALPKFARLGLTGAADASGDPRYGHRLSERAVRGLVPEGRLEVQWEEVAHVYPDGTPRSLRRPRLQLEEAAYGPLSSRTAISFRVAPSVRGVGLLEAVSDSLLASLADPEDADRDGISGRVHWRNTPAHRDASRPRAGRLGWKAAQASVEAQVIAALVDELGITTRAQSVPELTVVQRAARARLDGGRPELDDAGLLALLEYCRLAAVPERRELRDPAVRRGARSFRDAGCVSCHVPTLTTGSAAHSVLARRAFQPFTDLLLHDMGEALADPLPEGDAQAAEWRTSPLWGLGAATAVHGDVRLMHDGRARSYEEAVLWHGGEAARSRERFRALPAAGRRDLLRFLGSL